MKIMKFSQTTFLTSLAISLVVVSVPSACGQDFVEYYTPQPTKKPITAKPTKKPIAPPSSAPTKRKTVPPSSAPTKRKTVQPSSTPTKRKTVPPSSTPTKRKTVQPSSTPTKRKTVPPSSAPTKRKTVPPSSAPSNSPSTSPKASSPSPSFEPTSDISVRPSSEPSSEPSKITSNFPSVLPVTQTSSPSVEPSSAPSKDTSASPSVIPVVISSSPTVEQSSAPIPDASNFPSVSPLAINAGLSTSPSVMPVAITSSPSVEPSSAPSTSDSESPSVNPVTIRSSPPSNSPTLEPTPPNKLDTSASPSFAPTSSPTQLGDPRKNEKCNPFDPSMYCNKTCMEDVYKEGTRSNSTLICRARQVKLTSISTSRATSCKTGSKITLDLFGNIEMVSGRFDLGWYIGTDGGDAMTGTCSVNSLDESNVFNVTGGAITWSQDSKFRNDVCGDVFSLPSSEVKINNATLGKQMELTCEDVDGDGFLDFSICFSWRNVETDTVCDPSALYPGSEIACDCATYNVYSVSTETNVTHSNCI